MNPFYGLLYQVQVNKLTSKITIFWNWNKETESTDFYLFFNDLIVIYSYGLPNWLIYCFESKSFSVQS